MKSHLIFFLIVYLLILSKAIAQPLWEMEVSTYLIVGVKGDTTIENLYNILQADSLKNTAEFKCAAILLAIYEGQIAKDFILDRIDFWRDKNDQFFNWNDYFNYQRIKGYLGDSSAMLGMDSVVLYSNNLSLQINAISYLVEVGQLNYFELVKEIFNNQQNTNVGISLLTQYGSDPLFREKAINLLSGVVRDSSDYYKATSAARNLAKLDNYYTVELLEQRFFGSHGFTRYNFFKELDILDPQKQMKRSIWVIPREPDDDLRSDYIPFLFEGDLDFSIRGYLSPMWINFIKNWFSVETNDVALFHIRSSLEDFQPAKPNYITPIGDIIDALLSIVDTIKSYSWLGDQQFKDELQSIIQSAKTNLQAGDSVACAVKVKEFQGEVDFVYKDSLNTDPRFVTIEGWKFLYWNAQYILDRLPEPPVVVTLTLEVINPAMSLLNPGAFTMEVKGTGFTTNSVVYFNGNSRATTFISDNVLNAEILQTDVSVAGNFPVWVTEGETNSDTLIYKVVSTLPQPVRPVLECVTNNGDGTYTAFFGYKNDNDVSVYIPIGSRNKFTPNPQDRGQTRVFLPGRHNKVYTVIFNGSNLVWTLNGRTSTASSGSAPCQ